MRTPILTTQHTAVKIKESFIKAFVTANYLKKSQAAGTKNIYMVNGLPTQITASSQKFEARQLRNDVAQVICYHEEWRLFKGDEIKRGQTTRRSAQEGYIECNAILTGGIKL